MLVSSLVRRHTDLDWIGSDASDDFGVLTICPQSEPDRLEAKARTKVQALSYKAMRPDIRERLSILLVTQLLYWGVTVQL